MSRRTNIAGWSAESVGPPDGRRVEDHVALRPWEDDGRILHILWPSPAEHRAACHHFEARQVRRLAVVLPPHQPRDAVAVAQAGSFKDPVLLLNTGPVRTPIGRFRRAGPHQPARI